jgi:predicted ribosomally synthesized peptide with SipW-like signal peptide
LRHVEFSFVLHCCIFLIVFIDRILIALKHATHTIFRLSIRALPLIVAALMIAAQTLAAFHSVAHADNNKFAVNAERASVHDATNQTVSNAHSKFWTALFGHAADGADNAAACVAWDAAFAAVALADSAKQLPAAVVYSVATLPPVTRSPELADFLRLALARAPPRG